MKLKTAFTVSVIVNAIFLMAVGYVLATDIAPDPTTPLIIYTTNAPAAHVSSLAAAPK